MPKNFQSTFRPKDINNNVDAVMYNSFKQQTFLKIHDEKPLTRSIAQSLIPLQARTIEIKSQSEVDRITIIYRGMRLKAN